MGRRLIIAALLLAFESGWAITLDEAVDTALKKSPLLHIEREKIELSSEEKRAKKAKNFGALNVAASYTTYNLPRTLAPIVPPITPDLVTSKNIGSLGVKYDVMLFNGFSDLKSIEIAELSKEISKTGYALSKEQLIYNIKSIYFRILTLNSINILKAKLASTIGVEKIDSVEKVYEEERVVPKRAPKESLIYKKALLDLQKSEKEVSKAEALYYPKVAFNAYYGDNFASGEREELWQAGVSVNIPLFDFGNKDAQFQKAKIARLISKHKLKMSYLNLESDIVEAKERIAAATAKIESLEKQLEFLAKIEESEKIKYRNGASDIYDLLLAISKKRRAQSDLAGAKYDLSTQRAYLNYITAERSM